MLASGAYALVVAVRCAPQAPGLAKSTTEELGVDVTERALHLRLPLRRHWQESASFKCRSISGTKRLASHSSHIFTYYTPFPLYAQMMRRPSLIEVKKETKTVLIEFGENTTAHGVPRVTKARTYWGKIFWIGVCILCACLFFVQASMLIQRYFRFETTTQIEVSGS